MPKQCNKCGRWINKKGHKCPDKNPMQGVHRFGKESANWKGGKIIINGYVYIYSPNHLNKIFENYVSEHRLIMEKNLGRYLKPEEIVHHINENTFDNRIENLELITRGKHNIIHKSKDKLK